MASSSLRAWTIAAGIALGVSYVLSPFTVWFFIAAFGLLMAAGRGLPADERRRALVILSVAVALRLLAIAVLFLGSDHNHAASFFWDGDGVFLKQRGLWIRNVWLGIPIAPVDFENAFNRLYGWTTYLYVLAYLQYLMGQAPYGVHLLNLALFMATAILLYRIARSAYGPHAALLGLVLLAFLPTPFLWSISAMKESLYVFLEVLAMAGVIALVRSKSWIVKVLALGVIVAAVSANSTIRTGALAISVLGLAAGIAGSVVVRRLSLVVVVLALLPLAGYQVLNRTSVQVAIMSQLKTSAVLHIGNVRTEGHSYRVLDQRFYSGSYQADVISTMTPVEAARFAVRAIVSFVVVPFPWQAESLSEIVFVPQQLIWYAFVLLAIVGVAAGVRRDALVTCLLAGLALVAASAIALNSGNIGTMVRHRDTIVPFVIWLSAYGSVTIASKLASLGVVTPNPDHFDSQARALCR